MTEVEVMDNKSGDFEIQKHENMKYNYNQEKNLLLEYDVYYLVETFFYLIQI